VRQASNGDLLAQYIRDVFIYEFLCINVVLEKKKKKKEKNSLLIIKDILNTMREK
jgi:hypothetical protein